MILNMAEILAKDSLEGLSKDKNWIKSLPEAENCSIETVQMFGEFLSCVKHIIKNKNGIETQIITLLIIHCYWICY